MAGNVRGSIGRALRRVLVRAAIAAGTGFAVSVAIGVAAFALGVRPPEAVSGATHAAAAMLPVAPGELQALFVRTQRTVDELTVEASPADETSTQPFEASRVETAAVETPPVETAPVEAPRAPVPALQPGDTVGGVTLSFYYCEVGENAAVVGDGGGFCGAMRDGSVVRPGAAACDFAYLGQRFRIEGDPDQREYVCSDTGNLVDGLHRDIWFNVADDGADWLLKVGRVAVIQILP
jgi:hypothetical protein